MEGSRPATAEDVTRIAELAELARDELVPMKGGALWAARYFEVGGRLGRFIAGRYFYNSRERAFRLGILQRFAEDFRRVNRQVCIDTYANYTFTREFGEHSPARDLLPANLLDALNRVHAARRAGRELPPDEPFRIRHNDRIVPRPTDDEGQLGHRAHAFALRRRQHAVAIEAAGEQRGGAE